MINNIYLNKLIKYEKKFIDSDLYEDKIIFQNNLEKIDKNGDLEKTEKLSRPIYFDPIWSCLQRVQFFVSSDS